MGSILSSCRRKDVCIDHPNKQARAVIHYNPQIVITNHRFMSIDYDVPDNDEQYFREQNMVIEQSVPHFSSEISFGRYGENFFTENDQRRENIFNEISLDGYKEKLLSENGQQEENTQII